MRMDLQTYIADLDRRQALADAIPASPDYLWQIATNWNGRKPSPKLALAIEKHTEILGPEKVPKESLLPEVWAQSDQAA
jgi:hypothetical protein